MSYDAESKYDVVEEENTYRVKVRPSHIDWGEYRNPTNRPMIEGESYVKIPAQDARKYHIVRGSTYTAYFAKSPSIDIKASGNGPYENGIQYAKQFEGVGIGACKAFTSWYESSNVVPGDWVQVKFLSSTEIEFSIIKNQIYRP